MYIEIPWAIRHFDKCGFLDTHHNGNDKNNKKHWSQVVSTETGYQSFITYLETEFSVENLLFITEVYSAKITIV